MIKTKFSFFQVQIKGMFRHAVELCQAAFGKTPERFNTVDMPLTTSKFVITMMYPEVFIKTDIDQSLIATPPIRMNHGIRCYMPTDNGLQCGFRSIWHDLCVNLSLAFQNTKDDRFAVSATSS